MPDKNRSIDWWQFWVHFFFGALLGGLAGVLIWLRWWHTTPHAWLVIVFMACVIGIPAGFLGDRYWESFRDGGWNPLSWFYWW
jgi:hypothetical protein